LAFSSDGHLLAAGCDDGNVLMWSWSDQRSRPVLWDTGQGRVLSLAFHPGRQILATGGDIPQINLWQVDNPGQVPALFSELLGHEGTVNDLSFDPDGRKLASGSSDGSVMIWNVENLDKSPILLHDHTSWVWSVAFDAQGSTLVSGSNDRTVRLWNIRPMQLADTICQVVEGRELTEEEWELYVGPDFSYDEFYLPCTNRTVAIE